MKIGLLGSGNVGKALAKGFLAEGHKVWLATREPDEEKGAAVKEAVPEATVTDFEGTAQAAQLAVLCVPWSGAEDAVQLAGVDNLRGKVIIDTTNPLSHSEAGVGLTLGFDESAGETVQRWLPESRVVKCFNTIGAAYMYKPDFGTRPTMFIAGNDADAKQQVSELVEAFGWDVYDAGDITASRVLEPMATLWINNAMRTGDPHHAFKFL